MARVAVSPELLRWACARTTVKPDSLRRRFPMLDAWIRGERQPTIKQLDAFAKATHTPFGFLFLRQPLREAVPIPDFRTIGGLAIETPSPDLLETIHLCQQRQEWYRDYARTIGDTPRDFVGSLPEREEPAVSAARMRDALGFGLDERRDLANWSAALRRFIDRAEQIGVLVMVSGVVGSNNRRRLDPTEFRGFALVDAIAPLVFVNGADTKAAQMFTLAHELAHIWIGQSALSDTQPNTRSGNAVERRCNAIAAELLVPLAILEREHRAAASLSSELTRLSQRFKVSTLVILRRLFDLGALDEDRLRLEYAAELARLTAASRSAGGGDYYLTTVTRVGKRFATAIVTDAMEGRTLFRDACRMIGCSSVATLREIGRSVEVTA